MIARCGNSKESLVDKAIAKYAGAGFKLPKFISNS